METEEARMELRRKFSALPTELKQKRWRRVRKHLRCEVCKRRNCEDGGYITDFENEVHLVMCQFCILSSVTALAEGA